MMVAKTAVVLVAAKVAKLADSMAGSMVAWKVAMKAGR